MDGTEKPETKRMSVGTMPERRIPSTEKYQEKNGKRSASEEAMPEEASTIRDREVLH